MRVLQTLTSLIAFFTFYCSGYRGLEVGPEELYEGAADEDVLDCLRNSINNNRNANSCNNIDQKGKEIIEDNLCRYYSNYFVRVNGRPRKRIRECSCCGHFYQYIEQGKICTRYCHGMDKETSQLEPLIRLPFNWGDECPEEIFLGDRKTPAPEKLKECQDLMESYYDQEMEEVGSHQGDRVMTKTTSPPTATTRRPTTVRIISKSTTTKRTTSQTISSTSTRSTTRQPPLSKATRRSTTVTPTTRTTRTTRPTTLYPQSQNPSLANQEANPKNSKAEENVINEQSGHLWPQGNGRNPEAKTSKRPPKRVSHTVRSNDEEKVSFSEARANNKKYTEPGNVGVLNGMNKGNSRIRRRGKHKNGRRNRPQTSRRKQSARNKPTTTFREETKETLQISSIDGKPIWG